MRKRIKITVGYTCPHCGSAEQCSTSEWVSAIVHGRAIACQRCKQAIDAERTVYVPMQPEPQPS